MPSTGSPQPNNPPPPGPGRHRWRRRAWRARLVLGLVVLGLALAHRPLLVGFARLFRVDDPAPSDALVVLLGQWTVRPLLAADLYKRGLAPTVLMGTTDPIPYPDLNESALTHRVLIRAGVPAEAIRTLPGIIGSTQEEALRVRDYARTHPIHRITVVTTAFHTARARWIFRKALRGTGVEVRMAAARDPRFDESNWYRTEIGRSSYLSELVKTAYYRLVY